MPDDVNRQRAQRFMQAAATRVAALQATHLTPEDILSADPGELDAFTTAVDELSDLVLPTVISRRRSPNAASMRTRRKS